MGERGEVAHRKAGSKTLETNLDWVGWEDIVEECWEEVEHAVEVHAGDLKLVSDMVRLKG
jgi:hypothetical protein